MLLYHTCSKADWISMQCYAPNPHVIPSIFTTPPCDKSSCSYGDQHQMH